MCEEYFGYDIDTSHGYSSQIFPKNSIHLNCPPSVNISVTELSETHDIQMAKRYLTKILIERLHEFSYTLKVYYLTLLKQTQAIDLNMPQNHNNL